MMRHCLFSMLLIFIFGVNINAQSIFKEFKTLEERIKHVHPDSLLIFSRSIDTSTQLGVAISHWSRGKSYFWNSDYPKSHAQLDKAAQIIKGLENKSLLAEVYLDLSSSLAVVDKNGRALSFALEANELLKNSGSNEQQTRAAISLAEMYRKISSHNEALNILKQTLPKTDDLIYNKTRCLNRMAAVYSEMGEYDSSMIFSYKALELADAIDDLDLIATSENEIGYILRQQNKFEESLLHFFKADSLWRSVGMLRYATNPMHHVSVVYRSMHEFDKALDFTRRAYSLVKGKGWYQIEMNLLEDLKMCHFYFDNKDSVLFYDRERLEAAISFRSEQYEVNTRMVEIMFTQKENEQTIREQEVLLENKALEKLALDRERDFLWIILSLIGIILFIIFTYAYKQNRLKIQLTKENKEKESKNQQLSNALEANEALVQEISHRVKNNLAVLSGLLSMQAARSDNRKVIEELNDSVLRIESIATIHKKLYDKRTDAKVNLKEALTELSFNVLAAMGKNPQDCLIVNIDECEIEIAKAVTFCLIMNEVITNSCKYGEINSDSKLKIQLINLKDTIICEVADKGPGFEIDNIDNNTKSLGVYLIKLLARQLKATISWSKTKENFIFRFQLIKNE